jgi:hypothetical protein
MDQTSINQEKDESSGPSGLQGPAFEEQVDQLFVIQKVLGPLTPEHMEMFLRNPRFLGIQAGLWAPEKGKSLGCLA